MASPVSIGKARESRRRDQGWIPNTARTAAIRASRVPDGIRIETTAHTMTITPEQAQELCSQIRIESRKTV